MAERIGRMLPDGRWRPDVHVDRRDGLAWRRWVMFHGRCRWFVGLSHQHWLRRQFPARAR